MKIRKEELQYQTKTGSFSTFSKVSVTFYIFFLEKSLLTV